MSLYTKTKCVFCGFYGGAHSEHCEISIARHGEANCSSCEALRQENEALRQRLEINPEAPYDGIACRDETIKHLEKQVSNLKLALESDYR